MKTRIAYSYRRFSSKPQEKGSSLQRQLEQFDRFCEQHGLTPAPVSFKDEGASAYHGKHLDGDFGRFLDLVKAGDIKPGSVLVVEALDRFSRQRPDKAVAVLAQILEAGIGLGVVMLGKIFTLDDLGGNDWNTLAGMIGYAHYSSKVTAGRLFDAWKIKNKAGKPNVCRGGTVNAICPAWLRPNDDKTAYLPIEEKAAIVRTVFGWAADGMGSGLILRRAVKELPPIAEAWNEAQISRLLRDRRVIGERQPACRKDGKRVAVEGAATIKGYYPAVVDEGLFFTVQAAIDQRKTQNGRRGKEEANLFKGLIFDVRYGEDAEGTERYPLIIYGSGPVKDRRQLKATAAHKQLIPHAAISYRWVEEAVLGFLSELTIAALRNKAVAKEDPEEVIKGKLAANETRLNKIKARLAADGDDDLFDVLKSVQAERKALLAEAEKIKADSAATQVQTLDQCQSVLMALKEAEGEKRAELRCKAAGLIRGLVKRLDVHILRSCHEAVIEIEMKDGKAEKCIHILDGAATLTYEAGKPSRRRSQKRADVSRVG